MNLLKVAALIAKRSPRLTCLKSAMTSLYGYVGKGSDRTTSPVPVWPQLPRSPVNYAAHQRNSTRLPMQVKNMGTVLGYRPRFPLGFLTSLAMVVRRVYLAAAALSS